MTLPSFSRRSHGSLCIYRPSPSPTVLPIHTRFFQLPKDSSPPSPQLHLSQPLNCDTFTTRCHNKPAQSPLVQYTQLKWTPSPFKASQRNPLPASKTSAVLLQPTELSSSPEHYCPIRTYGGSHLDRRRRRCRVDAVPPTQSPTNSTSSFFSMVPSSLAPTSFSSLSLSTHCITHLSIHTVCLMFDPIIVQNSIRTMTRGRDGLSLPMMCFTLLYCPLSIK